MSDLLVVIDMQDRYVSSQYPEYEGCIRETVRQVELAKRRHDHVIVVEFDEQAHQKHVIGTGSSGKWPSISRINSILKNYPDKTYVYKATQDGGAEVLHAIKEKNLIHNKIRICGVYAGYCVKETVLTLARKLDNSRIKLVNDAITCFRGDESLKENAFKQLCFYENVSVM